MLTRVFSKCLLWVSFEGHFFFSKWESEMCCPGTAAWGDAGSQQLGRAAALPATAFASSSSSFSLGLLDLLGQSREKRRRRSLPRSQTLVRQPLREEGVEPALEAHAQPSWWGDSGPKKRVLKMAAEEMFFRKAREIASCFSEVFYLLFFAPFCLFLFGVKVTCMRQRISHCNSETAEAGLRFLVLCSTLQTSSVLQGPDPKPIELIFHWFH